MDRRQLLRTSVAGLTGLVAARQASAQQARLASGEQFESVIINATSGLNVLKNSDGSYSVKIISGDGTKNVTIVRYLGMTAEADAQLVHTLFRSMLLALRLDV